MMRARLSAAGVTLLALLVAAAAALSVAGAPLVTPSNITVVSPRLQAVLKLDHQYAALLRANSSSGAASLPALGAIPSDSVYSLAVAKKLMWHSASAYCTDNANLQDWTCDSCQQFGAFTVTAIMDDTTNQGYVGYFTQGLPASPIASSTGAIPANSPFVVVSFRGTIQSLQDWIEDLSFSKFGAFSSDYPDAKVHSGFWDGYNALKPGMMSGIEAALSASGATTILLTGHSLGGAMAELAALDLKLNEYPELTFGAYTMGCPRVGNPAFGSLYASSMDASFREVHADDVVPHLPPLLLGFSHAPMEIWWDEDFSSYSVCNGTMSGEDPQCSDSVLAPISVSDHLHYHGVDISSACSNSKRQQLAVE